ncbi:MAG: HD domain-containing protein [Clostridiales bacterium]|nr:HD domain-containing protein [Clostridiales bacterium]
MAIALPPEVRQALRMLHDGGYQAYAVGGCVRDSLLGRVPADWDVTTSAAPEQVRRLLSAYPVIETGLKHGTLTVRIGGRPLEITTYRVDMGGRDHRHPDAVRFTPCLTEDLARRDFTVNAMAYNEEEGLIDRFGGQEDLERRLLRCVGEPDRRFEEDALRILRALRFASVLDFAIDEASAGSLVRKRGLLVHVSAERVREELLRLLRGTAPAAVLRRFPSVIGTVLPELTAMVGFDQNNPHHLYDVYEHTIRSVEAAPPDPVVRTALLFHDSGKPASYTEDEQGVGHFRGHAAVSLQLAEQALARLKFDKASSVRILALIRYHDAAVSPTPASLRRWLNRLGEEGLRQLLLVKAADNLAQHPAYHGRQAEIRRLETLLDEVLAQRQCFSLTDLAVNGRDLQAAGIPAGPGMGMLLHTLLEDVIEGRCENDRQVLLSRAALLFDTQREGNA